MSEGVASLCIGLDKAIYRKLIVSLIGVILLCLIEEARIFSYFCIVSGHVSSYLGFRYLLRRRCFFLGCRTFCFSHLVGVCVFRFVWCFSVRFGHFGVLARDFPS